MVKTADLEGGTSFTHVSLVGAPAGERYCFPGVGNPPDFLVPVRRYQAQDIKNRYLVQLSGFKKDGRYTEMRRQENQRCLPRP